MAKCKVCGKEFTPCRTNTPLNWRRVACCAEHGAIWFEKIEAAPNRNSQIRYCKLLKDLKPLRNRNLRRKMRNLPSITKGENTDKSILGTAFCSPLFCAVK